MPPLWRRARVELFSSHLDRPLVTDLVSIVIPCRDQALFLADAIESALAQTYRPVEVIVVDDGSVDETRDVTHAYADVEYLRQEAAGPSSARNLGLRASRGEYLVFLDADDRLRPDAVKVGIRHLAEDAECAFVSGNVVRIDAEGSDIAAPEPCQVNANHYAKLLARREYGIPTPACVVYRRVALDRVGGFDPTLSGCADYDLNLRIAREFSILCHPEVVAEYRWHASSMSRRPDAMLKDVLAVLRSQRDYVQSSPELRRAYVEGLRFWKRYYGTRVVAGLARQVRAGELTAALKALLTLLRYHPLGILYAAGFARRSR